MASTQAAQVVYTNTNAGSSVRGALFKGVKFCLAHRMPMRSHYTDLVRSNGGAIVMIDTQADYLIVDHMRKDLPPGSLSYRFLEQSVKDGALADAQEHLAGPAIGEVREIGSTMRSAKTGGRVPYTVDDDRQLYKWVKDFETRGGRVLGNEIYKQLEVVVSHHSRD